VGSQPIPRATNEKAPRGGFVVDMAERVGFEPTWGY